MPDCAGNVVARGAAEKLETSTPAVVTSTGSTTSTETSVSVRDGVTTPVVLTTHEEINARLGARDAFRPCASDALRSTRIRLLCLDAVRRRLGWTFER